MLKDASPASFVRGEWGGDGAAGDLFWITKWTIEIIVDKNVTCRRFSWKSSKTVIRINKFEKMCHFVLWSMYKKFPNESPDSLRSWAPTAPDSFFNFVDFSTVRIFLTKGILSRRRLEIYCKHELHIGCMRVDMPIYMHIYAYMCIYTRIRVYTGWTARWSIS